MRLECLAIGSLPYKNLDQAMSIVKENFYTIPYWPQLAKMNKNEDMAFQYTENMPSFFYDEDSGKAYFETENDEFYENLETFFVDYKEIISGGNAKILDKYGISSEYASSFGHFLEAVKESKSKYAKGQIAGPFTLSTTLVDGTGKFAVYDKTLKEIIVKSLSLKALWQVQKIKDASPDTIPIIFIDEPSMSQLGTSAFITVSRKDVIDMLKKISDLIKKNGGISAVHCCGKCDWSIPIEAGIDLINPDSFLYAKNFGTFNECVEEFLNRGGKIVWGVVPTLDKDVLEKAELKEMIKVFEKAVKYLTKKGINEKIIIDNSLVSPSCGAGGLSEELAYKAMCLTKQLSDVLKEKYSN